MDSLACLENLVAIVLTCNSQTSLPQVLQAARVLTNRILVVDSFSQDDSCKIASQYGCDVVQHEFIHYGQQRNWAQNYSNAQSEDWFLHLDSDEVITSELAEAIRSSLPLASPLLDGFLIRRLVYFLGHPIRFGHTNPSWHLRLFRAERGYCEERWYDQHFVVPGPTQRLAGLLLDLQAVTLEQWTQSHNRWSSAEARQILEHTRQESQLPARLWTSDIRMRKRWWKNKVYYGVPPLLRAFLLFFYSYIIRLGFLDGKIGFIYHVLQVFWFRFLVDAKVIEGMLAKNQLPVIEIPTAKIQISPSPTTHTTAMNSNRESDHQCES